jgi:hypothetical protein
MTESALFPAFVALGVATALWLILVWWLFTLLQERAPETYVLLGRPHIVLNNTPSNNLAFLRFLLGGHYASVRDSTVRKVCGFLRGFFWLYLVGFMCFAIAVFAVQRNGI